VTDVNSFIGEVCGRGKHGAAFGYTRLGDHPILDHAGRYPQGGAHPTVQGVGQHEEGMLRFCDELIARVERAGASGVKVLRADSGFWNAKVFRRLEKAGWQYSIGVRMIKTVRAAVDAIDEETWQTIKPSGLMRCVEAWRRVSCRARQPGLARQMPALGWFACVRARRAAIDARTAEVPRAPYWSASGLWSRCCGSSVSRLGVEERGVLTC